MNQWMFVCKLVDIPKLGARVVKHVGKEDIAIFRTDSDSVFALTDRCPHKGGPLSQGIIYGDNVVCPLHSWHINLTTGDACAPDVGCARKHQIKIENDMVYLYCDDQ